MITNLQKFKKDLDSLVASGNDLILAMQYEAYPEEFEKKVKPHWKKEYASKLSKLPNFRDEYQSWYSEALVVLKQLLPDRVADFKKLYEKPKNRKTIEYGNYVIEDYLQSLVVTTSFGDRKVGPEGAIHQFEQQLCIVKSIDKRFSSSLFDIKQLVQADIFDSELEAARELNKKGFHRGAGAVVGVVLEKHLSQVCENHELKMRKKNPSISDFNDALKNSETYETPTWRKIQHLGDLRNLCDHNKSKEPTKANIEELIDGTDTIIKTIF